MQITFKNKRLKKLLDSKKEVLLRYGADNGTRILKRLGDISNAANLGELAKLPQTRVHELGNNRDEQISIDVKHPFRLILASDHEDTPRKLDGGLDWDKITQVKILEIVDTHKK